MAERNLRVDHVTISRWVQCYAPELTKRCRRDSPQEFKIRNPKYSEREGRRELFERRHAT